MAEVVETPEFLAWCMVHPCPLRSDSQLEQPLATERSLKSLRAVSQARHERRVFDGVALDRATVERRGETPLGFPIDEVVSMFGGVQAVVAACQACPANVDCLSSGEDNGHWAGCFGWLALDGRLEDLPQRLETLLKEHRPTNRQLLEWTVRTQPSWYGLWLDGVLSPDPLAALSELLEPLLAPSPTSEPLREDDLGILAPRRLLAALRAAHHGRLAMAVELIPRGTIKGSEWWWRPHCPRCKSHRLVESKTCSVCGCREPTAPRRRRKTRGTRPFIPLRHFLGGAGERELLGSLASFKRE